MNRTELSFASSPSPSSSSILEQYFFLSFDLLECLWISSQSLHKIQDDSVSSSSSKGSSHIYQAWIHYDRLVNHLIHLSHHKDHGNSHHRGKIPTFGNSNSSRSNINDNNNRNRINKSSSSSSSDRSRSSSNRIYFIISRALQALHNLARCDRDRFRFRYHVVVDGRSSSDDDNNDKGDVIGERDRITYCYSSPIKLIDELLLQCNAMIDIIKQKNTNNFTGSSSPFFSASSSILSSPTLSSSSSPFLEYDILIRTALFSPLVCFNIQFTTDEVRIMINIDKILDTKHNAGHRRNDDDGDDDDNDIQGNNSSTNNNDDNIHNLEDHGNMHHHHHHQYIMLRLLYKLRSFLNCHGRTTMSTLMKYNLLQSKVINPTLAITYINRLPRYHDDMISVAHESVKKYYISLAIMAHSALGMFHHKLFDFNSTHSSSLSSSSSIQVSFSKEHQCSNNNNNNNSIILSWMISIEELRRYCEKIIISSHNSMPSEEYIMTFFTNICLEYDHNYIIITTRGSDSGNDSSDNNGSDDDSDVGIDLDKDFVSNGKDGDYDIIINRSTRYGEVNHQRYIDSCRLKITTLLGIGAIDLATKILVFATKAILSSSYSSLPDHYSSSSLSSLS